MIPPSSSSSSSSSVIDTPSSSTTMTTAKKEASRNILLRQQSLYFLCSCAIIIVVICFQFDPNMPLFPVVAAFAFRTRGKTTRNKLCSRIRRREEANVVYGDHTCPLRREHLESVMTTTVGVSSVSRLSSTFLHSKSSSSSASESYLDSISYQLPSIMEEQLVGATSNYLETLSSVSLVVPFSSIGDGCGAVMEESIVAPSTMPIIESSSPLNSSSEHTILSPTIGDPLVHKDDNNNRVRKAADEEQQQRTSFVSASASAPTQNLKKGKSKMNTNTKASAKPDSGGLFAPAVLLTKDLVGDIKLTKLRSTIIGMHAEVIGKFTSTSQTDFGNQVLKVLFALADKDNNGTIDEEEFTVALQALGFDFLKEKQIASIFKRADGDKNGTLDIDEWTKTVPTLLKVNLTLLAKKNGHDLGFMV